MNFKNDTLQNIAVYLKANRPYHKKVRLLCNSYVGFCIKKQALGKNYAKLTKVCFNLLQQVGP